MTNYEQQDNNVPPPVKLGGADTDLKISDSTTASSSSHTSNDLNLLSISDSNNPITSTTQPDSAAASGMRSNGELLAMLGDPTPDGPARPGDPPPRQPDTKVDSATLKDKVEKADAAAKNGPERIADIDLEQQAIAANKKIETGPDGKPKLSDKELTRQERTQYVKEITDHIQVLAAPVQERRKYAQQLLSEGKSADAEKVLKEAKQAADKLPLTQMQAQIDMPAPKFPPAKSAQEARANAAGLKEELLQAEATRQVINGKDGALKLPVKTRQDLGFLYSGVEGQPDDSPDPAQKLTTGKTSVYSPQKAATETMEAARLTENYLKKNTWGKTLPQRNDDAPMLNRMNLLSGTVESTLPKPDPKLRADLDYIQPILDQMNQGSDRPIRR